MGGPTQPTSSQEEARWSKPGVADAGQAAVRDLERQLAEHRGTVDRLARERDLLLARVAELERDLGRRGERHDEEAETLRAELAEAQERTAAARQRISVLEELVAELSARSGEGRPVAAPAVAPAPATHRRRRIALALAGLIALGGAGVAGAALAGDDAADPAPTARAPVAAEQARAVRTLEPCAQVAAPRPGRRVTCTTGRTLVIAAGSASVVLRDLEARVLRATRTAETADVRLRIQPRTSSPQTIGAEQVVLGLDGERLLGTGVGEPVELRPGRTATVDLRFALTPEVRSALGRSGNRADLAIAPFAGDGEAARWLGVVRLTLGRAG